MISYLRSLIFSVHDQNPHQISKNKSGGEDGSADGGCDRAEVSRIFVQCEKNRPKIVTDFGCSLRSSDGKHSLIEVDWSGLGWKAGFRNHDVIKIVNGAKVKGVGHRSLLTHLQKLGRTCTMLIKRKVENKKHFYWIAFKVGVEAGDEPIIAKKARQSAGQHIQSVDEFESMLPAWAKWFSKSFPVQHQCCQPIMIQVEPKEGSVFNLGYFATLGSIEPEFTKEPFRLNMHIYESIYDNVKEQIVAFSAIPKRRAPDLGGTGCLDMSDDDDDDDNHVHEDVDDTEKEVCLSGDSEGPLKLVPLEDFMTGTRKIILNSEMFGRLLCSDGSFSISTLNEKEKLYVYYSNANVYLGEKGSTFTEGDLEGQL
ncbi:uncharacterized protein LOC121415439 [Lytechinus variegatus]|uniref:uncharacterized protein LOC121415439 n=1 Tax=Lytechinus variegatus TaxID=7654 RepID=UPI001BB0E844|nr:uncharacterized protein LOC121415439 [Lytechinus variegatus]